MVTTTCCKDMTPADPTSGSAGRSLDCSVFVGHSSMMEVHIRTSSE